MLINQQALDLVFKGFQSVYTDAFLKAEVDWDKIAMQAGTGPGWYLLDLSRQVRPIVFQERKPYDFVAMIEPNNPDVLMNKEYIYDVEGSRALRSARYIAHKSTAWKAVDCSCDASRRSFPERYLANTSPHRRNSAHLVESTKRVTGWDR